MLPLTLLIDADYFLYRAANSAEEEMVFTEDLTCVVGSLSEGQRIFKYELKKLRQRFDTDKVLLTWTSSDNFRKDVDENYKGNRTKRKPCGYNKLKKWAMETYPSISKPRLEADDVMGIVATKGDLKNFVLVSPDKDMQQIPTRIYNLKDEFTVTPESAVLKLYEQALTGDTTDGYKGCPGVGPKKAAGILKNCNGEYWAATVEAFTTYLLRPSLNSLTSKSSS